MMNNLWAQEMRDSRSPRPCVDPESAVPNLKCGSSLVAATHMMMKSLNVEFLCL